MLRGILRNVQFYLLFFSVLLVLLAFQRLQWYDQGLIPYPHYFLDGTELMGGFKTSYGRSMRSSDSGEDSVGGRIYYGGDESKEIGLLKFRIGLFKFVLPTFSKDTPSWSQSNERFLTIPPPPNEGKRNNSKIVRRENKSRFNNSDRYTKIERKVDGLKLGASVAYVAFIPRHFSPTPPSGGQGDNMVLQQSCQLAEQARVLKKSIEKAHGVKSKYDYRLYAINAAQNMKSSCDVGAVTPIFTDDYCHDVLRKVGYKLIEIDAIDVEKIGKILMSVFSRHEIIVQISFDAFFLQPIDNLFENLLQSTMGKDETETKSQIESFSLEGLNDVRKHERPKFSHKGNSNEIVPLFVEEGDLFIFKSNFPQTLNSYTNFLKCIASSASEMCNGGNNFLRKGQNYTKFSCKIQTREWSTSTLDRCVYDSGSLSLHRCPGMKSIKDVVVGRFDGNKENGICGGAPVLTNEYKAQFCMELRAEWFNLIRESTLENNVIS